MIKEVKFDWKNILQKELDINKTNTFNYYTNEKFQQINNKVEINGFQTYNNLANKIEKIEKQEDDSKSYIKAILEICSNNPTTSNNSNNNINGVSQNKKVQLEGIELSAKEISTIENNDRLVQDFELFAFAKVLGVSADKFNS